MNDYINAKLIADIASKPRLTALTLRALALRVIMLKELNEADVTDVEQELEIEEIMEFFDSYNLTISEHADGTIVFHTKVESPVISLRKTKVPHDVLRVYRGKPYFNQALPDTEEEPLDAEGYPLDADEDGEDGPVK